MTSEENRTPFNERNPTTFLLLRHGQTESNHLGRFVGQLDSPLTALGMEQAEEAAQRLRNAKIDVVYSSSLGRAVNTAKVICRELRLPLHTSDQFQEMCFGPWQGCKIDDAEKQWPEEFHHFRRAPQEFALPGAESFHAFSERLRNGLHAIDTLHTGKRVLVVCHGVVIKVLELYVNGRGLEDFPSLSTIKNCHYLEVRLPLRAQ